MKRYLTGNRTIYIFVLIQAILYVTFLILDLTGGHYIMSANIKFSIIILCFCYALFLGKDDDKSILFCMRAGLFFTVISDLFLLILDYYIYGVVTFIIVQQIYGIRILLAEHKDKSRLVFRILLQISLAMAICLILLMAGVMMESLLVISVFYFICILTNSAFAVRSAIRNKLNRRNVIFALGMILFLLCDINVGIFNMSGFVVLPQKVYHLLYSLSSILMWSFYAPAQVFIALSTSKAWQNRQKIEKSLCKNMYP